MSERRGSDKILPTAGQAENPIPMSLLLLLLPPFLAQDGPPAPPLPPGMVLLEGECVSHPDGAPVPGVHLTMRDPTQGCKSPETQTTATDAEGKFRFAPFPRGKRWIVTRSPTDGQTRRSLYPPTDHDVDPAEPGTVHLRIVLGEFGTVKGRVVDAETGSPVRGATVAIRNEGSPIPVDPATGAFHIPRVILRSRGQQLVADAPGYAATWGVLRMEESSIEGMTLRMRRARTLGGTVRDASRKPLPGLYVEVQGVGRIPFLAPDGRPEEREDSPGRVDVRGDDTDSLGTYRVDGLDPDFTWSVALRTKPQEATPGTSRPTSTESVGMKPLPFRKEGLSAFSFAAQELVKTVDLVQVEGTPVRGTLLDEKGEPLAGGGILLCAASIVNEIVQGEPLILVVPASDGGPAKLRWAEGASDRVRFLEENLQGHVRFREAHIRKVDAEGKFSFEAVEPGPHLVFARRPDYQTQTFLREVGAEPGEWTIRMPRKSEIFLAGRVLGPDGAPIGAAKVKAVGIPEGEGSLGWTAAETTSTAEGTYTLRFSIGGRFRLEAHHGGRVGVSDPLEGPNPSLDLRIP